MRNMEKIGIFFSVILISVTLFYAIQPDPSNSQTIPPIPVNQTFPTPTIVPKTGTQKTTMTPTVNGATAVPSVVGTTPSSNFCDELKLNSNDDSAFMTFVQNNNIITRISKLPLTKLNDYSHNCDKAGAISLNQLILTQAKPKSPTLIQAREFLISATTYCQIPDSASATRTQDDLKKYSEKVDEYHKQIARC